MENLHQNLIDGEWVGTEGSPNINPSNTDEVVGHYAQASAADAQNAIAAAKAVARQRFATWLDTASLAGWAEPTGTCEGCPRGPLPSPTTRVAAASLGQPTWSALLLRSGSGCGWLAPPDPRRKP